MTDNLRDAQLFIDDKWIADFGRVTRTWHAPRKYRHPLLVADQPWEEHCPVSYGSVIHWQGAYHMWYMTWSRQYNAVICYARSDDGLRWEKPNVGLFEFNGAMNNNVVLQPDAYPDALIDDITIIPDPDDDKWPLKALYWDSGPRTGERKGMGYHLARSKDGIHWEKRGCVLPNWGDRFNVLPVKHDGQYILLGREPGSGGRGRGRIVSRTTSKDLKRWTKPQVVITATPDDPPYMEIYSTTPFIHAGVMFGAIERMHMSPHDVLDPELTFSRDAGVTWTRIPSRPTFIPRGEPGSFDSDWVALTTNQPIYHHDSRALWFYYSGRSTGHDSPHPFIEGGIGLASLRLDGFCSMMATEVPGFINTPAMTWPGDDLALNRYCRRHLDSHSSNHALGQIRVEVRDATNNPIKGFTLADCKPVTGNASTHYMTGIDRVTWGENKSLHKLKGKRIRLRFELRDAHLYAFRALKKDEQWYRPS